MATTVKPAYVYTLRQSSGMVGDAWSTDWEALSAAEEALQDAMGWDTMVTSDWFTADAQSEACCAYETQDECDADAEGAHAPRIVRHRVTA